MYKKIVALIFLYSLFFNIEAQEKIKGKLIDADTGSPISYASICILPDSKLGTTSNLDGEFDLLCKSNNRLYISSLGYHDTIISVFNTKRIVKVELKKKTLKLDEVKVISEQLEKKQIGSMKIDYHHKNGKERIIHFTSSGATTGVYVKLGKENRKRVLTSINCCVGSEGILGSRFLVRIMTTDIKVIATKMEKRSDFYDLCKQPIIFTAAKKGWNEIDCRNYNIQLPNKSCVIFFIPINDGDQFKWENEFGEAYGSTLVMYSKNRVPKLHYLVVWKDDLAYLKKAKFPTVPAIVVNYLE